MPRKVPVRELLRAAAARTMRAIGYEAIERRAAGTTSSSLSQPSEQLLSLFGATTRSGAQVSEDTAFNVSTVRACINFRANLRAMLPVKLYRSTARGPEEQREHPVSRLLRGRVGAAQNSFQWRHYRETCGCLGGNAYTRIVRDGYAEISSLEYLRPYETEPRLLDTGRLVYKWRGQILQDFEVIHDRGLSTNGLTGRSPLADLRETVGTALTAQAFAAATFANGNRQPGAIKGPATWTKEKASEFLAFWQQHYSGSGNGGKTPVLFGGVEWQNAGFSLQDAELLSSRKFDVEEIARVYGVPLHVIGSTEKATTWGSGIEQLNRGLVDYVVTPMVRADEAEMNDKLLSEKEKAEGYYIRYNLDALLRGSLKDRVTIYETLRRICAIDVNQIRELEEWSLYPDGWAGDPRQPLNAQQSGQTAPDAPESAPQRDPAATM